MTKKIEHTPSSGNVFTDLGLPNADEHLGKAQEAVEVACLLESTKLTKKARTPGGKVRAATRRRLRTDGS